MTSTDMKYLLKWNTLLWLAAMALPAFLSISLASTKFPWPVVLPLLLVGPMLASNRMISLAAGRSAEGQGPK